AKRPHPPAIGIHGASKLKKMVAFAVVTQIERARHPVAIPGVLIHRDVIEDDIGAVELLDRLIAHFMLASTNCLIGIGTRGWHAHTLGGTLHRSTAGVSGPTDREHVPIPARLRVINSNYRVAWTASHNHLHLTSPFLRRHIHIHRISRHTRGAIEFTPS